MIVENTELDGVLIIKPDVFEDNRGFFMEAYQAEKYRDVGISDTFIQDNHAGSKKGSLRGLHYQVPRPQAKLVRAVVGQIYDVAVDIRRSSPTFGKWVGSVLSAENRHQLYVPRGFAHGYYVLSDWAEIIYKASEFYSKEGERSILWNDPELNIEWPMMDGESPLVSEKDAAARAFREADVFD